MFALTRPSAAACVRTLTSGHQVIALVQPPTGLGTERRVEPAGEQPVVGGGQVGVEQRVVDDRVLHPHDAEAGELVERGHETGAGHLGIRTGHHAFDEFDRAELAQRADGTAVGMADDLPDRRLGRRGVDAGELERPAVGPHHVVIVREQRHGPIGARRVEPTGVAHPVRQDRGDVAATADPRVGRVRAGPVADRTEHLLDRRATAELQRQRLLAGVHRVGMAVAEAGHDASSAQVDHLVPPGRPVAGLVAEGHDPSVGHGDRVGGRHRRQVGDHRASGEQGAGHRWQPPAVESARQ
ncbi:MAG: hypothetical protein R2713_13495 [Ilumatobacteraceae bacterium]